MQHLKIKKKPKKTHQPVRSHGHLSEFEKDKRLFELNNRGGEKKQYKKSSQPQIELQF